MKPSTVYGLCGILSAAFFVTADVAGSLLRPDYSVVGQAISELIERSAPHKTFLDPLLLGFHALVIPFAWGLHKSTAVTRRGALGPILLAGAGVLGVILTVFFPCDPGCEPFQSLRGTLHIVIAIPMGFSVLFGILALSFRFRTDKGWMKFSRYSMVTFIVGVVLAVFTLLLAESSLVGLLERALTASYLQWYVVIGAALIGRNDGA